MDTTGPIPPPDAHGLAGTDTRRLLGLDTGLDAAVPEYRSKIGAVRWLFHRRMTVALAYLEGIRPAALIDIGCGEGRFIRLLNQRGIRIREVWGIDQNPRVIHLATQIPNCTFARRSVLDMGIPDGTFEVAVCLDVLEHISEVERAIAEIRRIVRPQGYLITSEPVESLLYKSMRFLLKGIYSGESRPGADKHYYGARHIDAIIRQMDFTRVRAQQIPFPAPLDLFHVNLYQSRA